MLHLGILLGQKFGLDLDVLSSTVAYATMFAGFKDTVTKDYFSLKTYQTFHLPKVNSCFISLHCDIALFIT